MYGESYYDSGVRGEGHNWEGVYGHSGNYIGVLGHSEYVGVEGWSWMGVGVDAYSHEYRGMAPAIKVLACMETATQGIGVYGESKSLDQPGVYGKNQDWVGVDIHAW